MPTYATSADIQTLIGADEYVALTDRDGDGGEDAGVADSALAHAEGIANGYLARSPDVSTVPLSPVPDAVRSAVVDIAIHRLAGNNATEEQRFRYEEAMKWLRDVAKGIATIGADPGAADSSDEVMFQAGGAYFTRENQRGIL